MEKIREGFAVFLHDGDVAIGAVRQVHPLTIYVENAGDFIVPAGAVHDVHFEKVLLDNAKLDAKLQAAITRAHADEDPDNSITRLPKD